MVFNKLIKLDEIHFEIDRRAVYSLLGYRKGKASLSQKMIRILDNAFSEILDLVDPKGAYLIRKIRDKGGEVFLLDSEIVLRGESMVNLLRDSFAVIFMAVTVGCRLERRISQEMEKGNHETALVFDAIGSETVEAVANSLNNRLLTEARQFKHSLTMRFSPGYGDLPLTFQREMYEELSLGELGIEINDRNMLSPQKTITALIGIEK
ncbi:MAG: hypothetical protein ACE5OR_03315 [bacterium]